MVAIFSTTNTHIGSIRFEYMNHHFQRWISRFVEPGCENVDFFRHQYPGENLWVNPPFCMLWLTIVYILTHNIKAYVVVPHWATTAWWNLVWPHASHWLRLPQAAFTSVLTGHTAGFHDPGYSIYVTAINFAAYTTGCTPPVERSRALRQPAVLLRRVTCSLPPTLDGYMAGKKQKLCWGCR